MESSKRSASTWTVYKQDREGYFSTLLGKTINYELSKEEYLTMRSLQNDRSVVIKLLDKEFAVEVWDRTDCLKEAVKQVSDEKF